MLLDAVADEKKDMCEDCRAKLDAELPAERSARSLGKYEQIPRKVRKFIIDNKQHDLKKLCVLIRNNFGLDIPEKKLYYLHHAAVKRDMTTDKAERKRRIAPDEEYMEKAREESGDRTNECSLCGSGKQEVCGRCTEKLLRKQGIVLRKSLERDCPYCDILLYRAKKGKLVGDVCPKCVAWFPEAAESG